MPFKLRGIFNLTSRVLNLLNYRQMFNERAKKKPSEGGLK